MAPSNKQKLELTWIGKENRPKLEPRILLEDPAQSYHAAQRVTDNDIFDIHTHIIPRMKKVIDGTDPGGVTEATNWKGGGGFRYFRLAPSLLTEDKWGNWVISKEYNAAMLAEAVCKLEGFTYAPSETIYWQQGYSTESDFLYITTAHLTPEQLQQLNDEVGPNRSLLVLCTAFRGKADRYPNLTVRKIPKQVLSRCEWGHDDYSLQVENLPKAPPSPPRQGQQGLFDEGVGE